VSLKGITHNSCSIKGLTLETVKKVSNFSLNFQRKFQLVQHCRLNYGTYLEDAVHIVMALVTQILNLSLFWRRILPTCNKRDEHGVIPHIKCIRNQRGVFCTWNREKSRFATNIWISHTLPSFPLSIYGKEVTCCFVNWSNFPMPSSHSWTNRGLSWKLACMLCHWKPSHCPLSKVIPSAAPRTKRLAC